MTKRFWRKATRIRLQVLQMRGATSLIELYREIIIEAELAERAAQEEAARQEAEDKALAEGDTTGDLSEDEMARILALAGGGVGEMTSETNRRLRNTDGKKEKKLWKGAGMKLKMIGALGGGGGGARIGAEEARPSREGDWWDESPRCGADVPPDERKQTRKQGVGRQTADVLVATNHARDRAKVWKAGQDARHKKLENYLAVEEELREVLKPKMFKKVKKHKIVAGDDGVLVVVEKGVPLPGAGAAGAVVGQ